MMNEYYTYNPCGDLTYRDGRYYGHVRKVAHCRTTFSEEKADAGEWPIVECEPYAVPLGLIEIKGMPAADMTKLKAARQPIDPASFERWEDGPWDALPAALGGEQQEEVADDDPWSTPIPVTTPVHSTTPSTRSRETPAPADDDPWVTPVQNATPAPSTGVDLAAMLMG